jgi:tetratricopeptide (TPR) repeat protein
MKHALLFVLALNVATLMRDTNSGAANTRGVKEFTEKKYDAAASSFAKAHELKPSSQTAYNLGTAQIAAGKRAQGSATLETAVKDPKLRADALFNRGNSALLSNAFEHAIRDYTETLKLRPNDMAAKRNLEIALEKLRQQQKRNSGAGGKQNPQGSKQNQQQQQPSAGAQQEQQPQGQADAESLLRSVQQQEQEERRRMKAAGRPRERVGW